MVLWVLLALLTGLAALAVLAPLTRDPVPARQATDADISVYRDQLDEVDRDLRRGIIGEGEAEAARAEIGRRMLAARAEGEVSESRGPAGSARAATWGAMAAIPLISLAMYLSLGSPHLPGQPLEARMQTPPEQQDVQSIVVRVEQHLADNPEDGEGWEVLAPVYQRLGRFNDAARAWRNAIRLNGATAERQSRYGEAVVMSADGVVTDEARSAFESALELEPTAVQPRFYLALAAEQDGDWEGAVERWRALLSDAPEDAPWRGTAGERLAAAEQAAGGADIAAPTAEDVAAAEDMSDDERAAFVAGMVDRLAARLAEDSEDLEGWLRLARAHAVLGEVDEARRAIASARENFRDDAEARERIDAAERDLGLDS